MAESFPVRRSIAMGSDTILEQYCEPCYEVDDEIKSAVGYCQNCNEDLCFGCFTGHLRRKLYKDHTLVDKSTKPETMSSPQTQPQNMGEGCQLHHGKALLSFCHCHSKLCCKVCLTSKHHDCQAEDISKLAKYIQDSQELKHINNKLTTLNKGFNDIKCKTVANKAIIQKHHQDAINEMKKLREDFDKLVTGRETQLENIKEEEFKKIEKVSAICDIVTEQLNKMTFNLDKSEEKKLFIAMKQAEDQFESLKETFDKLQTVYKIREYKFEPDEKLKPFLQDLKVIGEFSFEIPISRNTVLDMRTKQIHDQMTKTPLFVKEIDVRSHEDKLSRITNSIVLQKGKLLIADFDNKKLKLVDTNKNKIISSIKLAGAPFDIAQIKDDEVAATVDGKPNKIQFISVSKKSLSKGRYISINGECRGIAYNEKDHTLIVMYRELGVFEIVDMTGIVLTRLDKDSNGKSLFSTPCGMALCPNMTEMYVIDLFSKTLTLVALNGDVKAVYKDSFIKPDSICLHKSGIVYAVGFDPNVMERFDPISGKSERFWDMPDAVRANEQLSISYCPLEDKVYIGMNSAEIRVFQMK